MSLPGWSANAVWFAKAADFSWDMELGCLLSAFNVKQRCQKPAVLWRGGFRAQADSDCPYPRYFLCFVQPE